MQANSANQAAFDTSAVHLLRQGKKSIIRSISADDGLESSTCLYRGPNGLMCAAGPLIDDAKYTPEIERSYVHDPKVWACLRDECKEADAELLSDLQLVHDYYEVPLWYRQLVSLANLYSLSIEKMEAVRRELEDANAWLYFPAVA